MPVRPAAARGRGQCSPDTRPRWAVHEPSDVHRLPPHRLSVPVHLGARGRRGLPLPAVQRNGQDFFPAPDEARRTVARQFEPGPFSAFYTHGSTQIARIPRW